MKKPVVHAVPWSVGYGAGYGPYITPYSQVHHQGQIESQYKPPLHYSPVGSVGGEQSVGPIGQQEVIHKSTEEHVSVAGPVPVDAKQPGEEPIVPKQGVVVQTSSVTHQTEAVKPILYSSQEQSQDQSKAAAA